MIPPMGRDLQEQTEITEIKEERRGTRDLTAENADEKDMTSCISNLPKKARFLRIAVQRTQRKRDVTPLELETEVVSKL